MSQITRIPSLSRVFMNFTFKRQNNFASLRLCEQTKVFSNSSNDEVSTRVWIKSSCFTWGFLPSEAESMYTGAAGTNGVCSYLHALITTVAVALKSLGCNLRHQIRCLQNEQSLMQQEVMNPAWHPSMKPKHGWLMWFRLIQSWTLFVLLCTSASFWSTTH